MKVLDRYIIKSMLLSYLICISIVLSFYIIIDLFANFDDFTEYTKILKETQNKNISIFALVLKFYFYHVPLIFYNLSPIITLMAAIFTITRMNKSNELTPLKSSGISMYRLFYPLIGFALVISLLMVIIQEFTIQIGRAHV